MCEFMTFQKNFARESGIKLPRASIYAYKPFPPPIYALFISLLLILDFWRDQAVSHAKFSVENDYDD